MSPVTDLKLVYVAHNRRDSAVRRRALAFLQAGVSLAGFMYRRDGDREERFDDWPVVDLGYLEHGQLLRRAGNHLSALLILLRHRRVFQQADVVFVRNLDLLALTWLAYRFSGGRARLVYECLDIHQVMTGQNLKARLARWLERRLLAQIDMLVVSSPGFLNHYFYPVQRYEGRSLLVENKLFLNECALQRPSKASIEARSNGPLVLVWVGILRCQKTLSLLIELARCMPDGLCVRFHGMVADNVIKDFEGQIRGIPNIQFAGAYRWPNGLVDAYDGGHFVWAQELDWTGGNSDWLLPNRIYEASHQGVLSIAISGSETAAAIADRQLGYVLEDAQPATVVSFLKGLERTEICDRQQALLGMPASSFVMNADETQSLLQAVVAPSAGATKLDSQVMLPDSSNSG